jgi:hypothetical protein
MAVSEFDGRPDGCYSPFRHLMKPDMTECFTGSLDLIELER